VGIHTGPVVVGTVGGGTRPEALALGETANVAARLQGVAPPDSIVVSGATLQLVPGVFLTRELPLAPLKGVARPIRAHTVLRASGVRSRLDVAPTLLTPLVGREQEVALLLERWERAEEGEGHAVLVSGEAGVGKSRLLRAFRERLDARPHTWLECRGSPYAQNSVFHPVIELVERSLGFVAGEDPQTKLERLERGIEFAGLATSEAVPLLAPLLSLPATERYPSPPFGSDLLRKRTIDTLIAWALGLARRQPLALICEDLHWWDPSSLELLGCFFEQSPPGKVLTLASFRPEFTRPWPARSNVMPLGVVRLSRREARAMVEAVTRDVSLPEPLVSRIVERADGIPLFVEEVTKVAIESGLVEERSGRYELTGSLAELAIPATLQDSLRARLDRLSAGKQVAQLGAVLGREFDRRLLDGISPLDDAMLEEGLAELMDAGLLYQRGAPPEESYTFKHALIRDAAYQSLLKSVRQRLHARVAERLEEHFPERTASEPEVLARHYDEAGLAAKAVEHYRRAGERATLRVANQEAIGHLRRALELLQGLPEGPERNRQELALQIAIAGSLGLVHGNASPECAAAYDRARELASAVPDAPELALVLAGLARSYQVRGLIPTSFELVERALEVAERVGDPMARASAHFVASAPLFCTGAFRRAREEQEIAIRIVDPGASAPRPNLGREPIAVLEWFLGYPDRALAWSEETIALAARANNPLRSAHALTTAMVLHYLRRDPASTRDRANELIGLSKELGLRLQLVSAKHYRGWARAESGDVEAGIAEIRRALIELEPTGWVESWPLVYAQLAECSWKARRHADALDAIDLGWARSREFGMTYFDAELQRVRGEMLAEQGPGSADSAERELRGALETAQRQEAKCFELRAATSLSRLLHGRGRRDDARALLAPIHAWFTEGFETPDLRNAKTLLEELS
jgi:tetratricopeptide (TPR) repeat protein